MAFITNVLRNKALVLILASALLALASCSANNESVALHNTESSTNTVDTALFDLAELEPAAGIDPQLHSMLADALAQQLAGLDPSRLTLEMGAGVYPEPLARDLIFTSRFGMPITMAYTFASF